MLNHLTVCVFIQVLQMLVDCSILRYSFFMTTKELLAESFAEKLLERFLRYVKITSQSDSKKADEGIMPSTDCQMDMARLLKEELEKAGASEVRITESGYTYGFIPASKGSENVPGFCLLSHIDTSEETSGKNVKPQVFRNYDGKPVSLECGVIHDSSKDEKLLQAAERNDTIITSDGSTLLGADDKAGCAEIITALEFLCDNPEVRHGFIEVVFSPDEETGHGMDKVPLELIKSKFAYTVDGGEAGELETECFNAYKSSVVFKGVPCHTGSARGKLVNAISAASAFIQNLPKNEAPETTDGFMGFYAPLEISGTMEEAEAVLLLRDFSEEGMERRKAFVEKCAAFCAELYGAKETVVHTKQYVNMKKKLDEVPAVKEKLQKAYLDSGITPVSVPIRGGTDGSRLTELGIPCPNIFTGGHNFHSRYEWASLSQMVLAVKVLIELARA